MKSKWVRIIALLVVVIITILIVAKCNSNSVESEKIARAVRLAQLYSKLCSEELMSMDSFDYRQVVQSGNLTNDQKKEMKELICSFDFVAINGTNEMGINVEYENERSGLYDELVTGVVYYAGNIDTAEVYEDLSVNEGVVFEEISPNYHKYTFTRHRSLFYSH